jgi:hypothetical protein
MKLKTLSLAIISALSAGTAGQAAAITLNNAVNVNVFTAGATAQDGLIRAFMRDVCSNRVDEFQGNITQPVSPGIYSNNTVLQSLYFCTIDGAKITGLGGQNLLLRKSSGDSGEGVVVGGGIFTINYFGAPVAVATTTNATGASNFTCTAGASTAAGSGLQAIQQWSCTAFPVAATAQAAGFADVEPGLLNTLLTPQLSGAQLNDLQVYNTVSQLFGVAVTKKLRDSLQKVEGLTVGNDTEPQMPSLSQTLLAGIFSGNIGTWDLLVDANNSFNAIATTPGVTAPASDSVFLVRRPDSSGTMASIRTMFLDFPCSSGTADIPAQNSAACGTDVGGPSVNIQQGTGGLLGCLKTLDSQNKWGIGFASMSNRPVNPGTGADDNWRWIKVDGISPTLLNGASGKYKLQTEGTAFYRKTGASTPVGSAKTFIDQLGTKIGTVGVLGPVNSGGNANQLYGGWQSGALVPASATSPTPDYANINTKPQSAVTRSFNSANTCQPEIVFGTPAPIN